MKSFRWVVSYWSRKIRSNNNQIWLSSNSTLRISIRRTNPDRELRRTSHLSKTRLAVSMRFKFNIKTNRKISRTKRRSSSNTQWPLIKRIVQIELRSLADQLPPLIWLKQWVRVSAYCAQATVMKVPRILRVRSRLRDWAAGKTR